MKQNVKTIKRAIKGDAEAFEILLFKEEKKLYYTALSYVKRKEDALDAIQEASYKAFLSIHQLRTPAYFTTWLIRILIRECYKILRNRNEMIPYEEADLLKKLEQKNTDSVNFYDLNEALDKLDTPYQTAIILFYYHDLAIKDIAEIVEKPVGTIKTHLRRARKQLKKELERSYQLHEKFR